jgi:hypothetical protein
MRRALLFLIPFLLPAEEWTVFRSGPFEVYTAQDPKHARATLNHLEQLRHTLGQSVSRPEMKLLWPVRVVVGRSTTPLLKETRDTLTGTLAKGAPIPAAWNRQLVRALIESSCGRMPQNFERGLESLYSTLQANGTLVTLGAPPSDPSPDWKLVHLLSVSEEYRGRLRTLLGNLQNGMDPTVAYKTAFEKTAAEIEQAAAQWPATATTRPNARAISPERDFLPRSVKPEILKLVLSDAQLAAGDQNACNNLPPGPDAQECRAWIAWHAGDETNARQLFASGTSARAAFHSGQFQKAMERKPDWPEPRYRAALAESDPAKRRALLKQAADAAPREAPIWQALAETQEKLSEFSDAARSWAAAERAAATEPDRAAIRARRAALTGQKLDYEEAERQRKIDERNAELNRLKNDALAQIKLAEAKARGQMQPLPEGTKIEQWWDPTNPPAKVEGTLERVDCLKGGSLRLAIRENPKKLTVLFVAAPNQLFLPGGGTLDLTCGPQRVKKKVIVGYQPQPPEPKTGVTGQASTLEFPK